MKQSKSGKSAGTTNNAEKFPEGFEVAIGPPRGPFGHMTRSIFDQR